MGKTKFPIIRGGGKSLLVEIFCTLLTDTDKIECEHFLWSFEFWWVGIDWKGFDSLQNKNKRLRAVLKWSWWKNWETDKNRDSNEPPALNLHSLISDINNSKLGSTQQQRICWHWDVARIISSQKIFVVYGLKHHIVEMREDVTDAAQMTDKQTITEDRATQPIEAMAESRNF